MKFTRVAIGALIAGAALASCQTEEVVNLNNIEGEILDALSANQFNTTDVRRFEEGYLIEGDIYMTYDEIMNFEAAGEQYRTTNLVTTNGSRNITMYAAEGGKKGYSPAMIAGLDEAIARFNAENLEITFSRTSNRRSGDIRMTRLSSRDENSGILGSAGFPTSNGDPYGEIKMSGILESAYGLSTNGIATIIAHEMGHCIGFRHTDYFNRSISCSSGGNEGSAGVGAIHIPGTPTGASLAQKSFMLSCTDGGNRPFNNDDKTALDFMY